MKHFNEMDAGKCVSNNDVKCCICQLLFSLPILRTLEDCILNDAGDNCIRLRFCGATMVARCQHCCVISSKWSLDGRISFSKAAQSWSLEGSTKYT